LTNILDNAFKFTVQGSVTVTADYQDPSQSHVSIRVADTGIGIPEEKHALIFEEFRQAEEGFNRPYEGFGLGLSIASKSVKLLGGSLSLRSRQEQGSTFTITLPVSWSGARPDIPERAIGLASIPVPAAKAKAGVPAILLVEDNEANIELVKLYLKKGYTVDVARGGEESLDMVRKKPYDCILMDINLGHGMDGIDAITGIRKLPSYQTVPIIAVTGYTFRNEKDFIISKGADYYIEKPFKRQDLIGILSEITGSG
jgi:CheY-like chemotaxis protein